MRGVIDTRFFTAGWLAAVILYLAGCGPQLRVPQVSPVLVESERIQQREMFWTLFLQRQVRLANVETRLRIRGKDFEVAGQGDRGNGLRTSGSVRLPGSRVAEGDFPPDVDERAADNDLGGI